jgi:hypothetical protein
MATVTVERIAALQASIAATINQTSDHSTLPELDQVRLLAQSCAETCDLLGDWLDSREWAGACPKDDRPVEDYVLDQKEFERVLGPMLKDAMARASRHGLKVPPEFVDEARAAVAAAARRRPMKSKKLFRDATDSVSKLQKEVCALAKDLRTPTTANPAKQRRARNALTRVRGLLLPLVIPLIFGLAGAGPSQAAHNLSEWGHEAVKVIAIQHIADSAQPSLGVEPPRAGPRLS